MFFHTSNQSPVKQVSKVYTFFWNLHTLKCKENIYLEYMNINRQPAATRSMIDIKHQTDTVLVDV